MSLDNTLAVHAIPNTSKVWMESKEKRKELLESIYAGIVDKHIPSNFMAALDQMLIKCTSTTDNYYVTAVCI